MSGASAEAPRLLAAVLDSLDDPTLLLDADRRVLLANRAFLAKCGRDAGEIIGRPCAEICGKGDACPVAAAFSGAEPQRVVEEIPSEGGPRWIERRAAPLPDEHGNIRHVLETLRDISAERRLKLAYAEGRAFCHGVNNPLFVALGTAELMADDASRADECAALLRNLRSIADLTRAFRAKIAAAEQRW